MARQPVRTRLVLALLALFIGAAWTTGGEEKRKPAAAEITVRDALMQFDKGWKDYTNEPNYGDPRWKLKMATLGRLGADGREAEPLLEEVAKEGSSWQPHTRSLATQALEILRGPSAIREALATYDLDRMDTAALGKAAPDFALADASGETYRLSQFRGKKVVVLTFILQDT